MRRLAVLIAALGLLWASPVLAAIANPTNIGATNVTATTALLSTTVDVPAGSTIFVNAAVANVNYSTIADTAGNTYSHIDFGAWTGTQHLHFMYANNTASDLPGPCTLTSVTYTTTVLTISSGGTCPAADALTSGMALSGGGLTAGTTLNGSCTLVAGAAVCNISGNAATCASACGTVTVSSVIKITITVSGAIGMTAAYTTGIATSTPLDVTGTMLTGTSTANTTISPAVTTGTLAQANEIVFGVVVIATSAGYVGQTPFTDLTGSNCSTTCVNWSYDIVASTSSVSYGPKWTTGRLYGANVVTFKGAGAAAAGTSNGLLMGVQ